MQPFYLLTALSDYICAHPDTHLLPVVTLQQVVFLFAAVSVYIYNMINILKYQLLHLYSYAAGEFIGKLSESTPIWQYFTYQLIILTQIAIYFPTNPKLNISPSHILRITIYVAIY